MSTSTSKKAVIFRFDRDSLSGFLNAQDFATAQGIELLTQAGQVQIVPYSEVQLVCFVKDFGDSTDIFSKKQYTARPKTAGLWVRFNFRNGESLEGLLSSNLLQIERFGFTATPPDSTMQRVFIPRDALSELEVLGVIGSALKKPKPKPASADQLHMFD